jgi:hypothetical protein
LQPVCKNRNTAKTLYDITLFARLPLCMAIRDASAGALTAAIGTGLRGCEVAKLLRERASLVKAV